MKISNTCPKCHSRRIVKLPGKFTHQYKITFGRWGTSTEKLDRHVCAKCGFTEQYAVMSPKFVKWANDNVPKDFDENDEFV